MTETVLQTKHPRPVFVDNGDSHARQMDDIYRLQRHIYDLTRKYYLLGRDNLLDTLNPPDGGSVLEIGCGTGRNLILAARKYPKSRFYGVDISDEMLTTARTSIEKAGLSSQISVVQGNATRFQTDQPFGERTFDRIFCSYTLSMIPEWKQVIGQACSALQPDGRVHIVDFGDQSGLPEWFRGLLFNWLARFHVSPRLDLGSACASVAAEHGLQAESQRLFRGYAQMVTLGTIR